MFGTKKIFCKIINNNLVVRVGGGFMGIEDFIRQYGQSELEKYNSAQQVEEKLKEVATGKSSIGEVLKRMPTQKDSASSNQGGLKRIVSLMKNKEETKSGKITGQGSPRSRTTSQQV